MIIGSALNAIDYLRKGKIIGYPTEGVYGLGCDPWNEDSVSRINRIKKRGAGKVYLLVASNINQLTELVDTDNIAKEVLESWPGHTTWLIPAKKNTPKWLVDKDSGLIAIRVSKHPTIVELCNHFKNPIISTSANISGDENVLSKTTFIHTFSQTVDYFVEGNLGNSDKPSIIRNMITGEKLR